MRIRTGIVEDVTGIHSAFVINFIKGRYVIFWRPCVCCEIITEAIHIELFQEFTDPDKLVVVVPLNPVSKQFPKNSNRHPHRNSSTKP